jgi:hypothetical protein
MSALTVLYLRTLGHPLGALSTTVAGELPALGQADLRVAVPVSDWPGQNLAIPRSFVVAPGDLAIVAVEAEFDEPPDVFAWRVVTTRNPDNTEQHHLERVGTGTVVATCTSPGGSLLLDVPRFGNESRLQFRMIEPDGETVSGVLDFANGDTRKIVAITIPNSSTAVAFVERYPPAIPVQLIVSRFRVGAKNNIRLDAHRVGDRQRLHYEISGGGQPTIAQDLIFGPGDSRKIATEEVSDAAARDVAVDGYPTVSLPAGP